MASVDYTYEDPDKGWLVECEVTATVVPYQRGTRDTPPDGGFLEDVEFRVTGFELSVYGAYHTITLTDALRSALSFEVKKAYEGDEQMQSDICVLFAD